MTATKRGHVITGLQLAMTYGDCILIGETMVLLLPGSGMPKRFVFSGPRHTTIRREKMFSVAERQRAAELREKYHLDPITGARRIGKATGETP